MDIRSRWTFGPSASSCELFRSLHSLHRRYTLLIGKPPFQTKDVKAIYRRIRENRYDFPADKEISASARELIVSILNSDPVKRPTLQSILDHPWFMEGQFPSYIPNSANDIAPDYSHLTLAHSRRNFEAVKRRATGEQQATTPPTSTQRSGLAQSIVNQERDFKNAVQPDSPISALLTSARQPLVQAPAAIKEPSLLRKLTAVGAQSTLSPVRRGTMRAPPTAVTGPGPSSKAPEMDEVTEEEDEEEPESEPRRGYNVGVRDRELAAQKARIVSQMAGMRLSDDPDKEPPKATPAASITPPRKAPLGEALVPQRQATAATAPAPRSSGRRINYDAFEHNLDSGLKSGATGAFRSGELRGTHAFSNSAGLEDEPPAPKVFVVSWLDYCAKYGMGFAMSDGTVSVHFNDSSSLVLAPAKMYFDHITPDGDKVHEHRRSYAADTYPSDLKTKVYLLHQFENYMLSRLVGNYDYTYVDRDKTRGMVYIEKYLRMKHVILFRLSNGILQFNFYDHTKLILSDDGLVVSVIDKHYSLRTWSLDALCRPVPESESSKEKRTIERVVTKLQYAR